MKNSKLLLLVTALLGISVWQAYSQTIMVRDLKLYVNCEEYFIKAMAYHPAPLGYLKMDPQKNTGGGYCSVKKTPFGEWKSACYDSDFFDGSPDVWNRWPAGPEEGWFNALWERDFPIMKELGVNTLRLYNANPTTRQASIEQLGTNGIVEPLGKNHLPFMNLAAEYGFKVIFPLVGDYTLLMNTPEEQYKQFLRNQIDEVGNHSALLMWNFSNELDLANDPGLVSLLNKYMDFIRNYTMSKWNRFIPVTAAVVDIPTSYDNLMATLNVDIFSTNAGYRGTDFQDLWTGEFTEGFSGFSVLSAQYNKPVFIAELGWHQLNSETNYAIPNWFNQIWKDLVNHVDEGCIGGCFFEYSDEPNKADPLQQTMGVVNFTVSISESGVRSDEPDAWNPDTAVKKDFIFESLKSGTVDGVAYNFNTDVFTLIGRSATS